MAATLVVFLLSHPEAEPLNRPLRAEENAMSSGYVTSQFSTSHKRLVAISAAYTGAWRTANGYLTSPEACISTALTGSPQFDSLHVAFGAVEYRRAKF